MASELKLQRLTETGDTFQIKTDAGETASTACVGFGLERLVLASFSQHGFDAGRWPRALREVVYG